MQIYTTLLCIYNEILNLLIRLLILSACQKAKRGVSTCTPSSLILNSAQTPGFRSQNHFSLLWSFQIKLLNYSPSFQKVAGTGNKNDYQQHHTVITGH